MLWNQTLASSLSIVSAIFIENQSLHPAAPVYQAALDCNYGEYVPNNDNIYLTPGQPVRQIQSWIEQDSGPSYIRHIHDLTIGKVIAAKAVDDELLRKIRSYPEVWRVKCGGLSVMR